MTTAIHTEGLVKRFGKFTALDGLDLEVTRGEVHGFLGPNGAGKSTTIRVLLGLLKADAGHVELLGGNPWTDVLELHRRVAYVPGDVSLWPGLSGGEAIDLLGNLRGGLDPARRQHLVERFELDPTKRGRQYSKGNRQKVAIIAALACDAELLILDEPTSGLDPLMEAVFQDEVAAEKDKGRTVLLSSHIMSEVEALADRVSIIRDGRNVQTGTLEDMRGQARVTITGLLPRTPAAAVAPRHAAVVDVATPDLTSLPGDVHLDEHGRLRATVAPDNVAATLEALLPQGLTNLTVTPASLEELFLQQYDTRTGHVATR